MKQKYPSPRLWLILLFCFTAIASYAYNVLITDKSPIGTYNGYPLYHINAETITVSSSGGSFYSVYIDDNQIAYNSSSYWRSYSLDATPYCDGVLHKLQLEYGSSDRSICYITSDEDLSVDEIFYLVTDDTAKVVGCLYSIQNAVIADSYVKDGVAYPVTAIEANAFKGRSALTSVTIPETVTSIGNSAFSGCNALKELTFNAVNCKSLNSSYPAFPATIESLTIGEKVSTIPDYFLYKGSKIENVTLPNSVTSIGSYAFLGCNALKELTFNAVKCNYCGSSNYPAFPASIESLTIGETVTTIPDYFLYNGSKIENVTLPNSVTSIGSYAFRNSSALTSVTIPETVTSIGNYAFSLCSALTSVTIPEAVTSIGNYAFSGCSALTSVTIPKAVTSIGNYAFQNCSSLKKNAYPEGLSNPFSYGTSISYPRECFIDESGVIYNTDKTAVYFAPIDLAGVYNIIDSTTEIKANAFYYCSALTSVTIPEDVTTIGNNAFNGCSVLTSKIIPEAVTSIGYSAFEGCNALTELTFNAVKCNSCGSSSYPAFPASIESLTIGEKVSTIPDYFLYSGSKIKNLTIPNSVTSIGASAFYNFNSLRSVSIGSGVLSIGQSAFGRSNNNNWKIVKAFWLGNTPPSGSNTVNAHVNYVANDQYTLSNQVKYQFLSSKFLVDGTYYVPVSPSERTCDVVDCIYDESFTDVTITDKVTNRGIEMTVNDISQFAFYDNDYIQKLSVSNNGDIGDSAFSDCQNLQTATVANNGDIGDSAFSDCQNLQTATVANNGIIKNQAFYNLKKLESVQLGDKISEIQGSAFYNCSALNEIVIPNSVTTLGSSAFQGCSSLKSATIGNNVFSLPTYVFSGCKALASISIPNSIMSIDNYAFNGCTSLSDVSIEDGKTNRTETSFPSWTSTNHSNYSKSENELNLSVKAGDILTFNYSVDSNPYDYLTIRLGDDQIYRNSGKRNGRFRRVFTEDCNITLYMAYEKNSYYSSGADEASVTDIWLNEAGSDYIEIGNNGNNPLFTDCPLDEIYIGRKISYKTDSSSGYSPFYRNTSLRTVEITDAETQIYDNEFYGCSGLKSLKIGNGVTSIGNWAFSGCSSLEYFSAGFHVETIGREAFSDCTGLTKYYSYSVAPPVCGDQALDDINKWECKLYVPSSSGDKYKGAPQWKEFFFIEELEAIVVTEIRIKKPEGVVKAGEKIQLNATVLPADATDKAITWSSSNEKVATVDTDGLVTAVASGEVTITATSTDQPSVSASVNITVIKSLLGDSNSSGTVNITDAVNTANYAIGNEVADFCFEAADVNGDGTITLADASGTVTILLEQPVETAAARIAAMGDVEAADADMLVIEDYEAAAGARSSVAVALDNTVDYVALQADVTVPEGVTLEAVEAAGRAAGHSMMTRRISDRTVRVAIFDLANAPFADNGEPLFTLHIAVGSADAGDITVSNVIASDASANEYRLGAKGGRNNGLTGVGAAYEGDIRVAVENGSIVIYGAKGSTVAVCAVDGTLISCFEAATDTETCEVTAGIYVVTAAERTVKVVVK